MIIIRFPAIMKMQISIWSMWMEIFVKIGIIVLLLPVLVELDGNMFGDGLVNCKSLRTFPAVWPKLLRFLSIESKGESVMLQSNLVT